MVIGPGISVESEVWVNQPFVRSGSSCRSMTGSVAWPSVLMSKRRVKEMLVLVSKIPLTLAAKGNDVCPLLLSEAFSGAFWRARIDNKGSRYKD